MFNAEESDSNRTKKTGLTFGMCLIILACMHCLVMYAQKQVNIGRIPAKCAQLWARAHTIGDVLANHLDQCAVSLEVVCGVMPLTPLWSSGFHTSKVHNASRGTVDSNFPGLVERCMGTARHPKMQIASSSDEIQPTQ